MNIEEIKKLTGSDIYSSTREEIKEIENFMHAHAKENNQFFWISHVRGPRLEKEERKTTWLNKDWSESDFEIAGHSALKLVQQHKGLKNEGTVTVLMRRPNEKEEIDKKHGIRAAGVVVAIGISSCSPVHRQYYYGNQNVQKPDNFDKLKGRVISMIRALNDLDEPLEEY